MLASKDEGCGAEVYEDDESAIACVESTVGSEMRGVVGEGRMVVYEAEVLDVDGRMGGELRVRREKWAGRDARLRFRFAVTVSWVTSVVVLESCEPRRWWEGRECEWWV